MPASWTTVRIVGPSMEPTLASGECWLVRRRARYRPGEMVLLRHPHRDELWLVKRIQRCEPEGYWVVGDNPELSDDSRAFGLVPADGLIGKLVLRYRRAPHRRAG